MATSLDIQMYMYYNLHVYIKGVAAGLALAGPVLPSLIKFMSRHGVKIFIAGCCESCKLLLGFTKLSLSAVCVVHQQFVPSPDIVTCSAYSSESLHTLIQSVKFLLLHDLHDATSGK